MTSITNETAVRAMSATVIVAICISSAALGPAGYGILLLVIGTVAGWEWSRLSFGGDAARLASGASVAVAAALFMIGHHHASVAALTFGMAATYMMSRGGFPILASFGILYMSAFVAGTWMLLEHQPTAAFWAVGLVVVTDTGAYFFGRAFGGPKLAPRISPGKTWSGLCGGVACAFAFSVAAAAFGYISLLAVLAAVPLALLAQAGDLFESHLKRRRGIKDSSRLIPGHGGVLDRLDGVAPVVIVVAVACAAFGSL